MTKTRTSVTLRTELAEIFFSPDFRDRIEASRINLTRQSAFDVYKTRPGVVGRCRETQDRWKTTREVDALLHKQHVVQEDLISHSEC